MPVTESTPLRNPFWQYSRDKIAGEDLLVAAYRDSGFPATIVRPSHTYDKTLLPTMGHWTDVARMRAGKPVVVHGDGTTQWTLTHADDFAVAFVGLFGHPAAIGEDFTITGTHAPTWNQIYTWLGQAAGVEPELVHVASETIALVAPELGPGLVGDKAHSMVFDCSKVSALVPAFRTTIEYHDAAHEQIAWFDANPSAQTGGRRAGRDLRPAGQGRAGVLSGSSDRRTGVRQSRPDTRRARQRHAVDGASRGDFAALIAGDPVADVQDRHLGLDLSAVARHLLPAEAAAEARARRTPRPGSARSRSTGPSTGC